METKHEVVAARSGQVKEGGFIPALGKEDVELPAAGSSG